MNLSDFGNVLQKSWSKETSYCPDEWNELNPSLGQCAVSALVVHDYFGGNIVWSEAVLPNGQIVSHYFNSIEGKEVDITRSQFPEGSIISKGVEKKKGFATARDFMLSHDNTKRRYELLRMEVRNCLEAL